MLRLMNSVCIHYTIPRQLDFKDRARMAFMVYVVNIATEFRVPIT